MRFPFYILFFFIIEFAVQNAYADSPEPVYETDLYTIEDGLSQTTVNCLIQDSRGFFWIGTQDGINKFDGYRFQVMKNDPSDSSSISNNFINCILEDIDGNIWIGTKNGLNKYDVFNENFTQYFRDVENNNTLRENAIYNIFQDKSGFIWIKTENFLSRLNLKSGKFRHYEHYSDVFNIIPENSTFDVFEDHRNQLWVGTKDGLNYFDRNLEIFKRYKYNPKDEHSISNNIIKVIFEDSRNNLWIGTENGLNQFNWETEQFTRFSISTNGSAPLSGNTVNDIFEDSEGNLWIASNNGLSYFDYAKKQFIHTNEGIINTSVTALTEDQSGNLWAGTFIGLIKVEKRLKKFNLYNKDSNGSPLFSNNYILAIFKESDVLCIGTWGYGLFLFNPKTNKLVQYSTSNSNIKNDFVHKIFKDSKNRVWIGTQNGICFFNEKTKKFENLNQGGISTLLKNNRVFDIFEDHEGNIWIGTKFGLYKIFNDTYSSFYYEKNDSNSLSSNHIYDIFEDSNKDLWIATNLGLNKINTSTGKIRRFLRPEASCSNCLSSNEIVSICEDTLHNCLWLGTISGLNKFDFETETFTVFTEKDGLPNNLIYAVLQDNNGCLWLSTNKGLSKFNIDKLEFSNFGIKDGLQHYEFNHGASFKSKDGEMFFGGINGYNSFYPDSIVKNQIAPNIEITSIEILYESISRKLVAGKDHQIEIPYKNNLVTIEFAALDFTNPEKNKYAYKLEGVENEWIDLDNRRYATFSNLPSGKYTFRVKGSNSDNVWNEEGTSLKIVVVTPLWLTNLAYSIYIILLTAGIFGFFQYRTRSLRKSNQDLKEKQLIALQVAKQKEELSIQNKNITDSIVYAKRIQEALMPSMNLFKKILPGSFILHKAKDIVSGDFYWINERNGKVFVAVVDCTGHGVPGAFMSIIGFELLRNITDDQGIESADQILQDLNKGVATTFGQSTGNIRLKDGMDIALCVIDKKKKELEFAGAFRPLYFIRDNKIQEIKGDRFSVGLMEDGESNKINKTIIKLQKDDVFYIFSDGYADQFGGVEGKKYKYRRYRHLLLTIHKLPLEQQRTYLDRSLEDWQGKHEQVDDVLIVGFKPDLY
jgi:ligand-binding sensor domain-containing protein/serine phosphatase RsbU (regulator of sigma subunit)